MNTGKTLLTLAACMTLAGCMEPTTDPSIKDGTYRWVNDEGCAKLVLGKTPSYIWDEDCDGSVDYDAQSVRLSGTTLRVDAATMTIEAVGTDSFSGPWTLFNRTSRAQFKKI